MHDTLKPQILLYLCLVMCYSPDAFVYLAGSYLSIWITDELFDLST